MQNSDLAKYKKESVRPVQIIEAYIIAIEKHLKDLLSYEVEFMFEIDDFAKELCVHPTHLTNVIRDRTGISACGIYQIKIAECVFRLLADQLLSITEIALKLDFDPSQFTKWFKKLFNMTPKQYRLRISTSSAKEVNSEMMTILKRYADIPLSF